MSTIPVQMSTANGQSVFYQLPAGALTGNSTQLLSPAASNSSFVLPQPITLTQQAQSVLPSTIESTDSTANTQQQTNRVVIQQADGTQQQATVLSAGIYNSYGGIQGIWTAAF